MVLSRPVCLVDLEQAAPQDARQLLLAQPALRLLQLAPLRHVNALRPQETLAVDEAFHGFLEALEERQSRRHRILRIGIRMGLVEGPTLPDVAGKEIDRVLGGVVGERQPAHQPLQGDVLMFHDPRVPRLRRRERDLLDLREIVVQDLGDGQFGRRVFAQQARHVLAPERGEHGLGAGLVLLAAFRREVAARVDDVPEALADALLAGLGDPGRGGKKLQPRGHRQRARFAEAAHCLGVVSDHLHCFVSFARSGPIPKPFPFILLIIC